MVTMLSSLSNTDDANDPPIIITGGGGSSIATPAAANNIEIDYDEDVRPPRPRKKIKARPNGEAYIKGVNIEVEGTDGTTTRTATLTFPFEMKSYKVTVTFATRNALTPGRPAPKRGGAKPKPAKKRK
jgi:hypothetical protein